MVQGELHKVQKYRLQRGLAHKPLVNTTVFLQICKMHIHKLTVLSALPPWRGGRFHPKG